METDKNLKKKGYLKISALLIILILLVVAAGLAYAKYVTSKNGTATATVAEFNFNLKNLQGEVSTASNPVDFPITRTDGNQKVQTGMLAPDTYGRFDMIIDSTGTQVSYRYDITVTVTNCPTNLIFYTDKDHQNAITTTRTGTGTTQDPKIATFTISKFVPVNRANEQHKEIVYWAWPYETGTGNDIHANDLIDSADMNKTVTMNIVAKGTQVLSQPAGVPVVGEQPQTISIVKLDVSQVDNTTATLDLGTQAEVVLSYTQTPTNLEDLFISSSDSSVATATVDLANNKVVVNALKKGTATITLRGEHSWNITKTIAVTVEGTDVNELVLSSDGSTVSVAPSSTENVTISNFANLHPVEQFTVTSSDSSIATGSYDGNGTITISGVASGTATITLTGTQSGTTKTIAVAVEELIPELGDYVNLETTNSILNLANTTLEDGTHPKADWRVFSKDSSGGMWLILSDYMPNSAFDVTTVGLAVGSGTNYTTYGVRHTSNRVGLINGLNNGNWSNLISGSSVAGKSGVQVKGAMELEEWIKSWEDKGYTNINTALRESMNDGLDGYYVYKDGESATTYSTNLSSDTNGYGNTLYFPHKVDQNINGGTNTISGYWLASPSANLAYLVMLVGYDGYVDNGIYNFSLCGVRPAVYLPSNIKFNAPQNGVWTIKP